MSNVRSFGTIRKLPSGRFQARYWHLGKQVSADTTFTNKTDARAFLAGIETDLRRGTFVDPIAGRVTFGEYASWWLEQRPVRPRTRETYESQLNRLLPTFANHELSAITPAEVRTWHGRLSKSGLSWNTVSKCYRLRQSGSSSDRYSGGPRSPLSPTQSIRASTLSCGLQPGRVCGSVS